MRVLINRIDNIGDIIYTLQLANLIKSHNKDASVYFLSRSYAKEVVSLCEDVDGFIDWDTLKQQPVSQIKSTLKRFDVFIHAKSSYHMAKLVYEAKIPMRIGSSRRWYHWLYCNKRVKIIRKNSPLHEIQLNTKLLSPLGIDCKLSKEMLWQRISVKATTNHNRAPYLERGTFNLIIHPSSNGNGRIYPNRQFIDVIKRLSNDNIHIILTGSEEEKSVCETISKACPYVLNIAGKTTLSELIHIIRHADGLIASGTGPLHLAALLGINTLGLFPPKHAIDDKRWGPPGKHAINLTSKLSCPIKCVNQHCACMNEIEPEKVARIVKQWMRQKTTIRTKDYASS